KGLLTRPRWELSRTACAVGLRTQAQSRTSLYSYSAARQLSCGAVGILWPSEPHISSFLPPLSERCSTSCLRLLMAHSFDLVFCSLRFCSLVAQA
ncbi:hypothetical protein IW145_006145, partial [Coemansia sp. RSA 521]